MSCIYPPSDVFRIAEPTGGENYDVTQRVEFVYPSQCNTAHYALASALNRDVSEAFAATPYGHDMPAFFLLCHPEEMLNNPDLVVSQYAEKYVEVRDIRLGVPLTYNFQIYVTDPAILGIFVDVPLPANLVHAKKIVAMRES